MRKWISSTIGDVTAYQLAGGTPPVANAEFHGGEIPFVVIEDMTRTSRFLESTEKTLTVSGLANSAAWLIREPHVLYSMYATVGKPVINTMPCATNQAIIALKEGDSVDLSYLYYSLEFMRPYVWKYTTQTTQSNLSATLVRRLPIFYPESKVEQKKIVDVLRSIDHAIEKTETLIDKYQQIKAGLMHDLFTRGIGPDGQLRPPREQAPELYKQTPTGWIPKEWAQSLIANYVNSAEYGISTSLESGKVGIPVLRMKNIQANSFDVSDLKYSNDPEAYRLSLKPRDVLYNRTNSFEHVGKTAIWKQELSECSFASYLVRINLDQDRLLPEFFAHWMSQELSQNKLRRFATPGVQQVNINPTNLQRVEIAVPEADEQTAIVARLDAIAQRIVVEKQYLRKLEKQKAGLMHDLLTGKVRVQVEEPQAAPAPANA